MFTGAIAPFLVGLSNKQPGEWTDPWVGGLMLARARCRRRLPSWERGLSEPLIPLHLFRIRTFSISVTAMFLAAFGFFAAIVFLPRWFQVVGGCERDRVWLQPPAARCVGLIVSATASGQIVARTGRYKCVDLRLARPARAGLYLLTNLHADTDRPVMWIWMIIAGLGIGPSFAVFTLIVQNSVPRRRIGVATSSLTFFQQIGGTVGLTIASTIFADPLVTRSPQLVASGVPSADRRRVRRRPGRGLPDRHRRPRSEDPGCPVRLTQAVVEPFIANIVQASTRRSRSPWLPRSGSASLLGG